MATLTPTWGACQLRMTAGERCFAQRLEEKLEDDYRVWYDMPVGAKQRRPDFVVLHPKPRSAEAEAIAMRIETATGNPVRLSQRQCQQGPMFDGSSSVKWVSMHSSKGLEFDRVFTPAVDAMPSEAVPR